MPFYTLATRPLIEVLISETYNLKQIWYADNATAAGKISSLKKWWDKLSSIGPSYGYFVNPAKSWLVTKDDHLLRSPVSTPGYIPFHVIFMPSRVLI